MYGLGTNYLCQSMRSKSACSIVRPGKVIGNNAERFVKGITHSQERRALNLSGCSTHLNK